MTESSQKTEKKPDNGPLKEAKKRFALHVSLIEYQDALGKADAQALAYFEGERGFLERANPKG